LSNKIHIPVNDPKYSGKGGGCYGFACWSWFESILHEHGELREGESIGGVDVDENGIHFRIDTK